MFQDLKVSTRLSLAFGVVLMLLLAVITVGVTRMQLIDGEMTLITAVNDVEIRHATAMESGSLSISVDLRDAMLSTDTTVTKELFAKMRESASDLDKEAAAIAKMFAEDAGTTQGEKDGLAKIQAALKELQPLRERIAASVLANHKDEALEMMAEDYQPKNAALRTDLEAFVNDQVSHSESDAADAHAKFENARTLMMALGALAVLLAIIAAVIVTRSVLK